MPDLLLGGVLLGAGVALAGWWYLRVVRHRAAVSRIPTLVASDTTRALRVGGLERWHEQMMPWLLGITTFVLSWMFVPLGPVFAVAVGFLFWVAGMLVLGSIMGSRVLRVEQQLAEAIDHMVTSLHAGIGIVDALGGAERDTRRPLKPYLSQFLLRLKLGEDPPQLCREMAEVLPLESFRLFFYALGVQWEGGGNLAPTLATTGRFIRDRVELGRRIRAQSTEARFSVLAILGLTYFLAALMYNMDPGRVKGFLGTSVGQGFAAFALFMQSLGAIWIARMSRVRY
jgi:tight adherence protein B